MPSVMWSPFEDSSEMATKSRPRSRAGDRETSPPAIYNPYFTGRPRTPTIQIKVDVMDRQQIIRTIKEKGIARQRLLDDQASLESKSCQRDVEVELNPSASLLPSPQIDGGAAEAVEEPMSEQVAFGLSISRPSSALHKGDFNTESPLSWSGSARGSPRPGPGYQQPNLATSPLAPWHDGFPSSAIHQARSNNSQDNQFTFAQVARPRAVSQISLSKSFSYQAPTSPLVNQSNAEDILGPNEQPPSVAEYAADQFSRRRTFSPRSLQGFASMLEDGHGGTNWTPSPPLIRRESSVPYKAHQPRRSVTSFSSQPQTPYSGSRRSSAFGSSPLQSAMIGSFEESILRGRMSSTPSKPLDFTAHIGVLGIGDCKPSLKCPPHITVPFPAVYYNYGTSSTTSDTQPSPYVGLVDLEGRCATASGGGARRRANFGSRPCGHSRAISPSATDDVDLDNDGQRRRRQKQRRHSNSPLQEPKNAYRIPAKGQLQIIIKNPNKTAVKLFLVPYDVTDIQPGQKTFIRQRSYSAGPIIDMPLSNKHVPSVKGAEPFVVGFGDTNDKPVLRYLVHLHICCTSKGRIWLYKSIRVVFANRVPDGKERLRNDVQLPEPKYSIYKPSRTPTAATPLLRPHLSDSINMNIDRLDGLPSSTSIIDAHKTEVQSLPSTGVLGQWFTHRHTEPSFRFPGLDTVTSRPSSRGIADETDPQDQSQSVDLHASGTAPGCDRVKSPRSPLSPIMPLQRAISPATDSSEGTGSFTFSRSSSNDRLAGSESLLSKRLRDLGMSRVPSPNGSSRAAGARPQS